jgi:hypothetical protein
MVRTDGRREIDRTRVEDMPIAPGSGPAVAALSRSFVDAIAWFIESPATDPTTPLPAQVSARRSLDTPVGILLDVPAKPGDPGKAISLVYACREAGDDVITSDALEVYAAAPGSVLQHLADLLCPIGVASRRRCLRAPAPSAQLRWPPATFAAPPEQSGRQAGEGPMMDGRPDSKGRGFVIQRAAAEALGPGVLKIINNPAWRRRFGRCSWTTSGDAMEPQLPWDGSLPTSRFDRFRRWARASKRPVMLREGMVMDAETGLRGEIATAGPRQAAETTQPGPPGACLWCGGPMTARQRGSPKRFCCDPHRMAFHSAARRFVSRMIDEGRLSVADLHASRKACAVPYVAISRSGASVPPAPRSRCASPIRVLWAGWGCSAPWREPAA